MQTQLSDMHGFPAKTTWRYSVLKQVNFVTFGHSKLAKVTLPPDHFYQVLPSFFFGLFFGYVFFFWFFSCCFFSFFFWLVLLDFSYRIVSYTRTAKTSGTIDNHYTSQLILVPSLIFQRERGNQTSPRSMPLIT